MQRWRILFLIAGCCILHPDCNGQGLGYEAAYAFIDYLFTEAGARRVYMYTEDYNIACQRLCEKLGARKEGFFLEFVSFIKDENGEPVMENTLQYAILKREWMERTRQNRAVSCNHIEKRLEK